MSQEQLAELSTVAQGTISAIETNPTEPRRPVTIGKLAKALNIDPADLRRSPDVKEKEPEVTLDQALAGVRRFMLHGDLTMQQVLETLAAIQAERERRGMK